MKRFFREWNTWFPSAKVTVVVFAFIALAQFSYLVSYASANIGHRSVVGTVDDDGGWNIQKTMITRWYKDNGWSLYGPFYFRINHTLQKLFPRLHTKPALTDLEAQEQSANLAIASTSAVSLMALALLLATLLFDGWAERLALTVVLTAALSSSETWAEFVVRVHPDLLFAAFVGWAFYFTYKMVETGFDRVYYRGSAVMWGLCTCIKLTIGLFLPGLILFVLRPYNRAAVKRAAWYAVWMFGAYFVIGFPQTITLDRPVRHLLAQNKLSVPGDWATFTHWWALFVEQSWRATVVLILASLFLAGRRQLPRWRALGWMWAFWFLSMLMLITRRILSPGDHYLFPLEAMFVVWTALALTPLSGRLSGWYARLPEFVRASLILLLFYPLTWGYIPESYGQALAKLQKCRPEAADMHMRIREIVKSERLVYVDPYMPFPSEERDKGVYNQWGLTFKMLGSRDFKVLALNHKFYQAFNGPNEPDDYHKLDVPDWREKREAYLVFNGQPEVVDPSGHHWKKTFENACEMQIYERQD